MRGIRGALNLSGELFRKSYVSNHYVTPETNVILSVNYNWKKKLKK